MSPDNPKRAQMSLNQSKWTQMDLNNPKWPKMSLNEPRSAHTYAKFLLVMTFLTVKDLINITTFKSL